MFSVVLKPAVKKDLKKLPNPFRSKIIEKIEDLSNSPFPYNSVKLSGTENLYRIRWGDYRVVYSALPEIKEIVIHYVGHRKDVYRDL